MRSTCNIYGDDGYSNNAGMQKQNKEVHVHNIVRLNSMAAFRKMCE